MGRAAGRMGRALLLPGRFVTRYLTRAGLVALAGALTLSGCALTFDAGDLGVPTSLAEPAQAPAQGTAFRVTKHHVFMFWGLVGASRPNADYVVLEDPTGNLFCVVQKAL